MAKGFKTAREAIDQINAKRNSGGGGGSYFKLAPGSEAQVRFLDDEIEWVWAHETPKDGDKYSPLEVCRDQDMDTGKRNGEPCPGCDKDYKRKMHAKVRLIQRDAPVFEEVEDDAGNKRRNYDVIVGKADQVVIWTVGKMAIEELDGASSTFKGLTTRDFKIKREGSGGLDTSYAIVPVVDDDGNTSKTPMSDADKALAADASEIKYRVPALEEWGVKGSAKGKSSAPATAEISPFKRRVA
jgi:hypothetical protein